MPNISDVIVAAGALLFVAYIPWAICGMLRAFRFVREKHEVKALRELGALLFNLIVGLLVFAFIRGAVPSDVSNDQVFFYAIVLFAPGLVLLGRAIERYMG